MQLQALKYIGWWKDIEIIQTETQKSKFLSSILNRHPQTIRKYLINKEELTFSTNKAEAKT